MTTKTNFINPEIASLLEAKQEVEQLLKETTVQQDDFFKIVETNINNINLDLDWHQRQLDQIKETNAWTFRFMVILSVTLLGIIIAFFIHFRS